MPWIFLILSGLLETCWILSLKYTQGFTRLLPTVLYVLFGFAATLLLSLSLKTIPLSTAYSVWVGVSVVGTLAADTVVFRQPSGVLRVICALLIVAGCCGLRLGSVR